MKENIDIREISSLAKLSLDEPEMIRAQKEIASFTDYIKILQAYCDDEYTYNTTDISADLRDDAATRLDDSVSVFNGQVKVPLTIGGEE